MARAGLGPDWTCVFANDFDHKKVESYRRNWGRGEMRPGDVGDVSPDELPGAADLAWASFPCQDLSLAGGGAGLMGERSGTFWPFWKLLSRLAPGRRMPTVVALENVCGALTSHGGSDFAAIGEALTGQGYQFGALVVDAALFLPQSRPRLFIIAAHRDAVLPPVCLRRDRRRRGIRPPCGSPPGSCLPMLQSPGCGGGCRARRPARKRLSTSSRTSRPESDGTPGPRPSGCLP